MYSKEIREKTGISRDTLRHYVDIGLIEPQRDAHNGYLVYSEKDYETLTFVLRAKNLGFSLEEIRDIEKKISLASCPHRSILPALHKNLSSVHQKIADLRAIEKHLTNLITDFEKRNCEKHPTDFTL